MSRPFVTNTPITVLFHLADGRQPSSVEHVLYIHVIYPRNISTVPSTRWFLCCGFHISAYPKPLDINTLIQAYNRMMFGRNALTVAPLLILLISRGHALSCHQSEYPTGTSCCPKCPAGSRVKSDCTVFKDTSCQSCAEGTFTNQPSGLKNCRLCRICNTGFGLKIKTSCTTKSDAVCEPLEGFYCIYPTDKGCLRAQKHSSCKPGQYISQNGTASTDTVCSPCSSGSYSDGTFPSCQPHTQCESLNLQLMKPGNDSADAECGEKDSSGANVGIGIGIGVCLVVVLTGLVFYCCIKKKRLLNSERKTRREFQPGSSGWRWWIREVFNLTTQLEASLKSSGDSSVRLDVHLNEPGWCNNTDALVEQTLPAQEDYRENS